MRVRFETTHYVHNLSEAREGAIKSAADFLEVSDVAAPALVEFEFKVETLDSDSDYRTPFKVTAYGSVKNSVLRPGV